MSKRTRREYRDEFKKQVVKLVTKQRYTIAETAHNLGVNANLLRRWKKESEQPNDKNQSPVQLIAMQTELKRLKKENKQLKMEHEILKKVAVSFAKEKEKCNNFPTPRRRPI